MTAIPGQERQDLARAHGPVEEPVDRTWWDGHRTTVLVVVLRLLLLAVTLVAWQLTSGRLLDRTFVSDPIDV